LQLEHGAHGGPGPRETSAFALLPPEVTAPHVTLRPAVLRAMALRVLQGVITAEPTEPGPVTAAVPKAPSKEPSQAGVPFRLVCYNVHGCRGMDGKFSPQRIARVISGLEPDVICLQELDQSRTRSGGIDQVDAIANSLRVDYHFHAVAEIDDGRFGNAVLSPHPLRSIASGPLPALRTLPGLEDRGVLWVTVAFPGCDVHVINTHLSILEQERRLQVDALMAPDWVGGLDGMPAVFCGDLNAAPDSYTCRRLGEQLRSVDNGRARRSALNTWSSRIPMRRIDHVFVTDAVQVREVRVPRTRLTRVASDHLPLVVDLSYPVLEAAEPPRRDVPVG